MTTLNPNKFKISYYGKYTDGVITLDPPYEKGDEVPHDSTITFKSLDFIKNIEMYINDGRNSYRVMADKVNDHEFKYKNKSYKFGYPKYINSLSVYLEYDPDKPKPTVPSFKCTPDFVVTPDNDKYTLTPELKSNFNQELPIDIELKLKDVNSKILEPQMFIQSESETGYVNLNMTNDYTANISFNNSEDVTCHQLNFKIKEPSILYTTTDYKQVSNVDNYTLKPNLQRYDRINLPQTFNLYCEYEIDSCSFTVWTKNSNYELPFTIDSDKHNAHVTISDEQSIQISRFNLKAVIPKSKLICSSDFKVVSNTTEYQLTPNLEPNLIQELPERITLISNDRIKKATATLNDNVVDFNLAEWGDNQHKGEIYLGKINGDVTISNINIDADVIITPPKVASVFNAKSNIIDGINELSKRENIDGVYGFYKCYGKFTESENEFPIKIGKTDTNLYGKTLNSKFDFTKTLYPELHYTDYTDLAPITKLELIVPFVGVVELNNDSPIKTISLRYTSDVISGNTTCILTTSNEVQILPARMSYSLNYHQHKNNMDSAIYNTLTTNNLEVILRVNRKKVISKSNLVPVTMTNVEMRNILNLNNVEFKCKNFNLKENTMTLDEFSRLNQALYMGVITKEE